MIKTAARCLFCGVPALMPAMLIGVLSKSYIGILIGFVGGLVFGYQITEPRPERGERR